MIRDIYNKKAAGYKRSGPDDWGVIKVQALTRAYFCLTIMVRMFLSFYFKYACCYE